MLAVTFRLNPMRIAGFVIATLLSLATPAVAQDALTLAPTAAGDLRQICSADRGHLWGADLCGPLLVVDPATRRAWASMPDDLRVLQHTGDGWVGTLPDGVPIANTSVQWANTRWIEVMGPLPDNATERRVLVAHEAWHRVQSQIGLAAQSADCVHLESERGRYFLRLEFRALATALRSRGRARSRAAQEALIFRAARLQAFAGAAASEAALDRNEGLAAYTGVKLGVPDGADLYAARILDDYDQHDAYARAYAYASGPAYGLLLDQALPTWRTSLAAYAPADLLAPLVRPRYGDQDFLREATERYGGREIAAQERTRAEAERARIADIRARYAAGPRLVLPLTNMQMEFDPNQVTPVEDLGSLYTVLTIRDAWGQMRAVEGALISADFTQLVLSTPDATALSGPGWSLALAPGYLATPADPTGARAVALVSTPQ